MREHPHVVTNVFKNILREIVDPVCSMSLFNKWMGAHEAKYPEPGERIEVIKDIIKEMRSVHKNTLALIIIFMKNVALFSE
jgi:hypothetical protein